MDAGAGRKVASSGRSVPADAQPYVDHLTQLDLLRAAHGVLHREEPGVLAREHRGGELGVADPGADRDHAPVDDLRLDLVDEVGLVGRERDEVVGRGAAPLDQLTAELDLHGTTQAPPGRKARTDGSRSLPSVLSTAPLSHYGSPLEGLVSPGSSQGCDGGHDVDEAVALVEGRGAKRTGLVGS